MIRASPIDPALRDPSDAPPRDRVDSEKENNITKAPTSPEPSNPVTLAKDISRPSSAASTHSTINHLIHHASSNGTANKGLNGQLNGSAHHSQSISLNDTRQSLPALSTLASIASAPTSSLRTSFGNGTQTMNYATASPAASTAAGQGATPVPPVCQNCQTSTTPLWRRDELGSVLCNACGLFLKLHGRARPISLKTDVIKSRNRVKTTQTNPRKKSHLDANGHGLSRSEAGTPPLGQNQRRPSGKGESGNSDRSLSPISRMDTPGMHHDPNIAPQHMFDGAGLNNHNFHHSPSLPALHISHPSPGSIASLNDPRDRHLEPPQTYDQLMNSNEVLKTRVSELEVINMMVREEESRARRELNAAHRTEDDLKRRVADLERQVRDLREKDEEPAAKRLKVSDVVES